MIRHFRPILTLALCLAALAPAASRALANEQAAGAEGKKEQAPEAKRPGVRQVPMRKPVLSPIRPLAVDGVKGVENFCGAIAESAASARLAWQEQRIKTLQAQLVIKIAELDAKAAEVREWVAKREAILSRAADNMVTIYSKMKPEAASAQLQQMDDDTAAAVLLKMKPAVASAVMNEMDAARAARLSDLLSAAVPRTEGKKS